MFKPWELAAIDQAGYNGIRDEHIDCVAESLRLTGFTNLNQSVFEYHCYQHGIDLENFTQADLERLKKRLND